MVDIVLNFVIAGRDTTASGLSWALFELTQNPEHVDTMCVTVFWGASPPPEDEGCTDIGRERSRRTITVCGLISLQIPIRIGITWRA